MKQVLLCSLLCCSFLMGVVACSSDDAEIMGPPLTDVNGDYQNGGNSKALDLSYSGSALSGSTKAVTFNSEDKLTAVLTIRNVIPGMERLELPEVLLTSSEDQTQFTFKGIAERTDCQVEYEGSVSKGKMSLSLSVSLVSNQDVVGRWILQKIQKEGEDTYKKQPVFFAWSTTSEFPGFKIKTSDGYNLILSTADVSKNIGEAFSQYMEGTGVIKELTLHPDGNVVMMYTNGSDGTMQESGINTLQYYIRDGRLYLLVDDKQLEGNTNEGAFMGVIKILLQQYPNGVPFACDATESGKLRLYLDKEVLMNNKVVTMMSLFSGFLPEQSDYLPLSLLKNVFENYGTATKATTKIELGLNFNKVNLATN